MSLPFEVGERMRRLYYSRYVRVPPLTLDEWSLLELVAAITEGMEPLEEGDCTISVTAGDVNAQFNDIHDLLESDIPKIDSLFVLATKKGDNFLAMVEFMYLGGSASCKVTSTDRVWLTGKVDRLKDFFKSRAAWLRVVLEDRRLWIMWAVGAALPIVAAKLIHSNAAYVVWVNWLVFFGTLVGAAQLSHPTIVWKMKRRKRRISGEAMLLVISLLSLVVGVVQVAIGVLKK